MACNFAKHLVWMKATRIEAEAAVTATNRNAQIDGVAKGKVIGRRESIYHSLDEFLKQCDLLRLQSAREQCFKLMVEMGDPSSPYYWSDLASDLKGVEGAIQNELSRCSFAFIPPGKDEFFEKDALFGEEVTNAFPSAE